MNDENYEWKLTFKLNLILQDFKVFVSKCIYIRKKKKKREKEKIEINGPNRTSGMFF